MYVSLKFFAFDAHFLPGWNNSEGCIVERNQPCPLCFYEHSCWERVFATNPNNIVLVSWNEFAEQTAMEPADSSHPPKGCEQWIDSKGDIDDYLYWNTTTVSFLKRWRALPKH